MYKTLLLTFLGVSLAQDIIKITYFQSTDCSGNPIDIDFHEIPSTCFNIQPPIQSFFLNRSMTAWEQLDFSTASNNATLCGEFKESFWNLSTTCQPNIVPSTCTAFWYNTGPSENISGPGWGWNNGTWVVNGTRVEG